MERTLLTIVLVLFLVSCSDVQDTDPIVLDMSGADLNQSDGGGDLMSSDFGLDGDAPDAAPDLDPANLPDLVINFVDVIPDPNNPGGFAIDFTGTNAGNVDVELGSCMWTLRRAGEEQVVASSEVTDNPVINQLGDIGPEAMFGTIASIDLQPSPGPTTVEAEMTFRCDPPPGTPEISVANNEATDSEFDW
mgnify:CR=1 FL=1